MAYPLAHVLQQHAMLNCCIGLKSINRHMASWIVVCGTGEYNFERRKHSFVTQISQINCAQGGCIHCLVLALPAHGGHGPPVLHLSRTPAAPAGCHLVPACESGLSPPLPLQPTAAATASAGVSVLAAVVCSYRYGVHTYQCCVHSVVGAPWLVQQIRLQSACMLV